MTLQSRRTLNKSSVRRFIFGPVVKGAESLAHHRFALLVVCALIVLSSIIIYQRIEYGFVISIALNVLMLALLFLRETKNLALESTLEDQSKKLQLYLEALNATDDAFALYDERDYLIAHNNAYEKIHERAFSKLDGVITYHDLMRATASEFLDKSQAEEWVQRRVAVQKKGSGEHVDRLYPDDRWLRVSKCKTPSGAVVGFGVDITELKQREVELELAQKKYFALARIAPVGIWQLSDDGRTLYANRALMQLFDCDEGQLLDSINPLEKLQWLKKEELQSTLKTTRELLGGDGALNMEVIINGPDDKTTVVLLARSKPLLDENSQTTFMLTLTDVTERKQSEQHIRYLAAHDSLTGLENRASLYNYLNAHVDQHSTKPFAFIMLDLDNFKDINDTLGHPVGDALLTVVADRIHQTIRRNDLACRLGGDEFAVVVTNIAQIRHVVERLIETLSQPVNVQNKVIHVSATAGVAMYPKDGADVDEVIQHADIALYHRKHLGRGSFHFFDPELSTSVKQRISLENDLRRAIKSGDELVLYYQPQFNLQNGELAGLEALMRWYNKRLGEWVSPDDFIPLAEQCGLIHDIDILGINQACLQMKHWHKQGHDKLQIAVNFSAWHFKHNDALAVIGNALATAGLEGEYLELEITEGLFLDINDNLLAVLNSLRDQGIRIAIDDFGTGYSSLSYLSKLPVDCVKVDRTFMQHYDESEYYRSIVRCLLDMSHSLKLETVVEGISSESQWNCLKGLDCSFGQGHYLAEPMSAADATDYLTRTPKSQALEHSRKRTLAQSTLAVISEPVT